MTAAPDGLLLRRHHRGPADSDAGMIVGALRQLIPGAPFAPETTLSQ